MATMTYSPSSSAGQNLFVDVENDVTLVSLGIRFANRMNFLMRIAYKTAALTSAFSQALEHQGKLIDMLNGPVIQASSVEQLTILAGKIDHLIKLNDDFIDFAGGARFPIWVKMFTTMRQQRDTLESIADSFRSASDPEYQAILMMAMETVGA